MIKEHNTLMHDLIGKDYALATYKRFLTLENLVKEFLQVKLSQNDFLIYNLSNKFLIDFEHHLKTYRKCNHNSAAKYVKNLKRIINSAISNQWIEDNPFMGHKITIKATQTIFLTENELAKIENKVFDNERLDAVKNVFLFQCYTGLAYVDNGYTQMI
ncbi:site-specific integrase [Chitinophaga parva]|nr:phage integrase SAM-like domain-containing protein [Chitinophaga parva]